MNAFGTPNTVPGVLTSEVFEEGMRAFVKHGERLHAERAARAAEVRRRIDRDGPPGPLQSRVDAMFIESGAIVMAPAAVTALNRALDLERQEARRKTGEASACTCTPEKADPDCRYDPRLDQH